MLDPVLLTLNQSECDSGWKCANLWSLSSCVPWSMFSAKDVPFFFFYLYSSHAVEYLSSIISIDISVQHVWLCVYLSLSILARMAPSITNCKQLSLSLTRPFFLTLRAPPLFIFLSLSLSPSLSPPY